MSYDNMESLTLFLFFFSCFHCKNDIILILNMKHGGSSFEEAFAMTWYHESLFLKGEMHEKLYIVSL